MTAPRLRFPPSPSGWLHVGGARTALYNWLWARRTGGAFVVRVEDTDAERVLDDAELGMLDALRWLGLDWDEGPHVEGPHGPYRQSDRYPLYRGVVDRLLKLGHAYDAYETTEELAAAREAAAREGRPPGYDGAHRDLSDEQRNVFLTDGRSPTIRLRTPDEGTIGFDDEVRGRIEIPWADIPDFVIQRADDTPTYYLANTVDDLAMGISLVARGEDLLSATPRQLLLTDLLLADGLIDEVLADESYPARPADALAPTYAHLPVIVGEDRKKLSKRTGDVSVDSYRQQGILPEVLVNFLALCGWSYDGVTERMTGEELTARFSFDRVGSNPAYFDTDKLRSLNGDRIKELTDRELAERVLDFLQDASLLTRPAPPEQTRLLLGLAPLIRERMQTLAEAWPLIGFAFADEVTFDTAAVAKHLKGAAGEVLDAAAEALEGLEPWDVATIHTALDGIADRHGLARGKAFQPIRVAVTGGAVSPPLPETLALLPQATVVARIRAARPQVAA